MVLSGLYLLVTGCAYNMTTAPVQSWDGKDLGSYPYHPLLYHLDLSILAYQLYSQTLVWPFDPYYEELDNPDQGRARFMTKVRSWAKDKGEEQKYDLTGLDAYRGPGVLSGFEDNPNHDPILYRYDRLHPWGNSITNAAGRWTEYMTPGEVTQSIRDVYICYRPTRGEKGAVVLEQVLPRRNDNVPNGSDILLAFEGETGDKGERREPGSQSLMGFVLLRTKAGESYDVHIAFRGSRSGSLVRAAWQAHWDQSASGNPDWITDLGYDRLTAAKDVGYITTTGAVHRGFAHSMKSILPKVFHCLNRVADIKRGTSPDNIFVTGHSLGGALAQHFVSAMLLGDQYGPGGAGEQMPEVLRSWPWKQIKLITYSAPRAGDEQWAGTLTKSGLKSEFFSTVLNPIDSHALAATDSRIVSRLLDMQQPVGYRVLSSRDPLTTEKIVGGKHVGKTVYVNKRTFWDALSPPDDEAHEPWRVREYMFDSLSVPAAPAPAKAWNYREMTELNPDRNTKEKGSTGELKKLVAAVKKYYLDNKIWFDHAVFDRDAKLRFAIDRRE
jgi:hypothetical protein